MTERKWTPGPWWCEDEFGVTSNAHHGYVANTGFGPDTSQGDMEAKANAHLIAAAPDLYEALYMCLGNLMNHIHNEYDGVYSDDDFAEIEAPYLAALAKARGEQ